MPAATRLLGAQVKELIKTNPARIDRVTGGQDLRRGSAAPFSRDSVGTCIRSLANCMVKQREHFSVKGCSLNIEGGF